MLGLSYDYASCVINSEKVSWTLNEVMPSGTRLDFSKPFLPEALARTGRLTFLEPDQQLKLNQIAGNAYLNLFGFVEEYILATVVQHAQAEMFGDRDAIRALVRFADEEVKHQQLFQRYREAFDRDFVCRCEVLESAVEVANVILSKSPIAVMMITLHIEVMTQQHYVECVKDDRGIDPLFASLLKHHWLEEAQHARIDALELDKLVSHAPSESIARGFDEYLGILEAFDGLLAEQAEMDIRSLSRATGRAFSDGEHAQIVESQLAAYRRTFIWYGMTNPVFVRAISAMSAEGTAQIAARTPHFA